ncbi:MAG: hypothetical protein JRI36_06530 [Deltaproteobacteria bacterium]|nr:hypothetical protein [Deltaproteobacteria bacterium]
MGYTNVADLTVDELKQLIREVVLQTIREVFNDPDGGLELREDVKRRLQSSLASAATGGDTVSAQEVASNLGLEW